MIPATIACAIAVVVLVWGEYHDSERVRFVAKPTASAAFIIVGLAAAFGAPALDPYRRDVTQQDWVAYQQWILIGLALGAVGDVALMFKRGFLPGLVSFLFGHIAYVIAFSRIVPFQSWLGDAGAWALAPACVATIAMVWMWKHLGTMRIPVTAYVAVIVTMVVGAIAIAHPVGSPDRIVPAPWDSLPERTGLIGIGACVFFASDLAVARDKFVKRSFTNRAWGLPAYYAAQLMLAWSLVLR